jgi:hypothetical protein
MTNFFQIRQNVKASNSPELNPIEQARVMLLQI